jgi:ABC-type glycerol-3-phosphate transport system substrate-binding protein
MKTPLILAAAALAGLAACGETQKVANQFEKTGDEIANTANTIETSTENAISATENALDENAREWQNKTLEVNVSVGNRQ